MVAEQVTGAHHPDPRTNRSVASEGRAPVHEIAHETTNDLSHDRPECLSSACQLFSKLP